jgi:hypothetical protein
MARRQMKRLIYKGRLKMNRADLIKMLDEYKSSEIPDGIFIDWYREKYGEGNGTREFPQFGFDDSDNKLYTFWNGDTQITLGENRGHGLWEFNVGRVELSTPSGVNDLFTDVSILCEWAPLQPYYETMAERLRVLEVDPEKKRVSKRGPHRYSDADKLKALKDWGELDKAIYPINVQDWLIERFGEMGGVPNVAKSTFYGWKKLLKKT